MKKKDIIQLIKKTVKENTFYGNREQPSQLSTGTKVSVPTDEYPFSAKPKRTATGMMEAGPSNNPYYNNLVIKAKEMGIHVNDLMKSLLKDKSEMEIAKMGYQDVAALAGVENLSEFQQPKSFDPDTIRLVREMLPAADIHHNELVGGYDEVSSYLDKRSGGTIIKFPHFNGPQGRGAMFGKETTDKIDASKAKAKSAALKTYTQFKQYIEDYEISDASPAGVYGNMYLWVMFNESAKDYSSPKGGTQSSQFEEIEEAPMFKTDVKQDMAPKEMAGRIKSVFNKVNGAKDPVKTPEWHKNRFKNKYGISFPESLKGINKDQALAMNKYANDMTIREEEGSVTTNDAAEAEKLAKKGIDVKLTDMNEENNINNKDNSYYIDQIKRDLEELDDKEANEYLEDLSKAILKLKKINENMDDEGRMAKSQMYKMQGYVNKLSRMLDDGAQLPGWVQSKLTKASDYMSSVFHYLEYEAVRGQDNLNEHIDKYKKRAILMEGAMKKFFEMFDMGKTDEEIVQEYAQRGTQVPEMFVNKARKQYEGLKKMKLELEMSEKEYKNSATQIVNNPATNEMDGSTTMEDKKLATDLFNEDLDPVGQEDDDIDNDGKSNTKTDKYLKNKRAKTSAAINKNKTK